MHQSNIKTSQHDWDKLNLVTIVRGGKMFDEVVCKNCGMKGRRYGFYTVHVSESYSIDKVNLCPKSVQFNVPEKVQVTRCTANGGAFENLTPGSVHVVIEPPIGYKNDHTGVWVMGVGEPVRLLTNEFTVKF